MSTVTIITDGSADNRTRKGGWCAIVRTATTLTELTGWSDDTTSNRMEVTAALEGLRSVHLPSDVTLIADSSYLLNTMKRKWYLNWIEQENLGAPPRVNMDLWYPLIGLAQFHNVKWVKIKGHSGDYWNERADKLAGLARQDKVDLRHVSVFDDERCAITSNSGIRCTFHSGHAGGCNLRNSRPNGILAYGEVK